VLFPLAGAPIKQINLPIFYNIIRRNLIYFKIKSGIFVKYVLIARAKLRNKNNPYFLLLVQAEAIKQAYFGLFPVTA
jgi:hypothetical protein